ncbi:uncharacterized protein LOC109861843 [Pseudomyrmex gracilis]|uniref:uncharacterized protein LOC109861843 n=1 Tax=Pseudomyrmex gracilis TaxID=219809 RepID=UPI000994AD5C|nr:uncharacterized protein LOC109861843 [Pseudomyrmex gracilis]
MDTPILTKKQQRHSLSAKKKSAKSLRNVLAQPRENYWPVVNVNQSPKLVTLMNKLFPKLKKPVVKLSASECKHMSKEERAAARIAKKEALLKEGSSGEDFSDSVIVGINRLTRALEKNNICCVLLDANVDPPLLIKHIVDMALNKSVPVLLLPFLKTVTLQTIGFASAAFALKRSVLHSQENVFCSLYELIVEVSSNFKPPIRSLRLFEPTETSEESANCHPAPIKLEVKSEPILFTDVYKYRSSRKERAFVPPTTSESSQISRTPSNEFIALGDDPAENKKESVHIFKNKRYVNVHKEKQKSTVKKYEIIEQSDEKFSNESELPGNSKDSVKDRKNYKRKRKHHVEYLPLKIKCIQKNSNRTKTTKFVKKKK